MQVSIAMRPFLAVASLSWPVQSLLICTAFLVVGLTVVDDYGVGNDTLDQRATADWNLAYIMGDADRLGGFPVGPLRYYGTAFELPLLLLEREMEGKDPHSIYLMRHLVTHGFFLIGGLCCSLLVYRLSNSRGVALFALLLFLLQPRLYAHSFFNSKDLPFLSMFMVTLYLMDRAFRKETIGAFVLCGMSVGILTNLRIIGLMLYPAVLASRGLDLVQTGREGRKQVLATGAVFALVALGTLYALSPYLWANPLEFVTAVQTLAHHPNRPYNELFQGSLVDPYHLAWQYIPTWMGISTPPVTLACGVLGVLVVGLRSIRAPRAALGNTDLRFGLLLVAFLTLPVVGTVMYGSHMYNDWRLVFFLHAPLSCLAGLGLWWAGRTSRKWRWWVFALVGLGVLVTGREMVRLHPHQHVYFNGLVDRTTPESLRTHYVLDPWMVSCREGLDFLRRRYPDTAVYVENSWPVYLGWLTFPGADRVWLRMVEKDADVQIKCGKSLQSTNSLESPLIKLPFEADSGIITKLSLENTMYIRKVYNSTLLTVTGLVTVPDRQWSIVHRVENTYRGAVSGRLVSKAAFDIYTYPGSRMLGYARNGCTSPDTRPTFFVHIDPVDGEDLPVYRRQYGFDNLDFTFSDRGRKVEGKCWAYVVLPDYEIARIRTGQSTESGRIWETDLSWPDHES